MNFIPNKCIQRGLLWGVLVVAAMSAQGEERSATRVKVSRPEGGAINRFLLGAQYNYFSVPTKQLLRDENLLATWRDMPVTVMRYPGGTWADHYLWDNPQGSYYAVGSAATIVTPEQFIESCRAIGAEPIFQVNTNMLGGEGSPIHPGKLEDIQVGADRAARWVREANKRKKWNVKYWEIGNEVWIWLKPEEYARYVVQYSQAMKAVDPTIKILACGLSGDVGPFDPTWLKFPDDPNWSRSAVRNNAEDWNKALQEIAMGHFDYIAPHIYTGVDGKMTPVERFHATNAQILKAEQLQSQVAWAKRMGGGVKVAVSEWACNFFQSLPVLKNTVPLEEQYFYSLGNGLNTGLMFGKIVESAEVTDFAILHSLDDFQTLWFWPKKELAKSGPLLHPIYYAMKIWGHHLGTSPLALQTLNAPAVTYKEGEYPALYSFGSEDDKNLYIVLINLDPDATRDVVVDAGAGTGPAAATWLKGKELSSQNFASWNGNAEQEVALTEESVLPANGGWPVSMPPHSMVGLTIPKSH